MIAFVFDVIAARTRPTSSISVSGSMSTNTGVAPTRATEPAVAKNEKVGDDDFIARTDAERHQRHEQRVGAGRYGDRVRDPDGRRNLGFQLLDFRSQNELLRIADARDRGQNVLANRRVLKPEIE